MSQEVPTSHTQSLATPLSMAFSRQEYWSGLPLPPPGDFSDPGIGPRLLHWQVDSLPPAPHIVVQSLRHVQLFGTPWTAAHQVSLSFTISQSLLKIMSVEWVRLSNRLILCCPLLLLPSILPRIRVFSNKSALHIRWPNYWSFSFSIGPSNGYSGLISFWFDFLAVQGILKNFLQHHSSKASILWVQISHSYMTTGKTIALTRLTFIGKVMSLLFNLLSMFVIAFLLRSKHLLIP